MSGNKGPSTCMYFQGPRMHYPHLAWPALCTVREGGSLDPFHEKLRRVETCSAGSTQELAEDGDWAVAPSLADTLLLVPRALGPGLKDPSSSPVVFPPVFPSLLCCPASGTSPKPGVRPSRGFSIPQMLDSEWLFSLARLGCF